MIEFPKSVFDTNLKELPLIFTEWELFCNQQAQILKTETENSQTIQILGSLGSAKKIMGFYSEAEQYLLRAISLATIESNDNKIIQSQIQLADVYRYQKKFDQSEVLFELAKALLNHSKNSEILSGSFYQHYGKFYFDQNFYKIANCYFELALKIRQKLNAPADQIESTILALTECQKRLSENMNQEIKIRIAEISDAENIHNAHMKSINEICIKDHTADEIRVWGGRSYNPEIRIPAIQTQFYLVVEYLGNIEGFCQLKINCTNDARTAYLYALCITPTILKQKIGYAMMSRIIEYCAFKKIQEINLTSSFTAFNFYKKIGFVQNGEMGGLIRDGILIRGYPMKFTI